MARPSQRRSRANKFLAQGRGAASAKDAGNFLARGNVAFQTKSGFDELDRAYLSGILSPKNLRLLSMFFDSGKDWPCAVSFYQKVDNLLNAGTAKPQPVEIRERNAVENLSRHAQPLLLRDTTFPAGSTVPQYFAHSAISRFRFSNSSPRR